MAVKPPLLSPCWGAPHTDHSGVSGLSLRLDLSLPPHREQLLLPGSARVISMEEQHLEGGCSGTMAEHLSPVTANLLGKPR